MAMPALSTAATLLKASFPFSRDGEDVEPLSFIPPFYYPLATVMIPKALCHESVLGITLQDEMKTKCCHKFRSIFIIPTIRALRGIIS